MAISKEQWKEIADQLSKPYGRVDLKCGARLVMFRVQLVSKLKFGVVTYIDGELRGEWTDSENEIGKLFLCRRERFIHTAKSRADYIKAFGGKRCSKAHRERAEAKYVVHDPVWSSVAALRGHYSKLHPDAEIVQVGHAPANRDASPIDKLKGTLSSMGIISGDKA